MPTKPLRCCAEPGCHARVSGSRCALHRRDPEAGRVSAAVRGYGRAHQDRRSAVLARDPFCVACRARGQMVPTTVDDHIVPRRCGGSDADMANHQGLCASCHGVKRAAESRGRQLIVRQGVGFVDAGPLATRWATTG